MFKKLKGESGEISNKQNLPNVDDYMKQKEVSNYVDNTI